MSELSALFAALEKRTGGTSLADNLKFDNEDDAIDHIKKFVALKPGDEVFFKNVGREPQRGVFFGPVEDGKRAQVMYLDEDHELCSCSAPWGSLRLSQ